MFPAEKERRKKSFIERKTETERRLFCKRNVYMNKREEVKEK